MPTVVAYQGRVWSIGGWETIPGTPHGTWTTGSFIYDPAAGQWTAGPDLGRALDSEPSGAVAGGQILLFTGLGGGIHKTSRVVFGPLGGAFDSVTTHTGPMGTTLAGDEFAPLSRAAAIGSRCYVLGGRLWSTIFADLKAIDVASVAAGRLQSLAPMRHPRQQPGLAAAAGRLYVFGGDDLGYGPVPWVEEYTP